jgi:integrase/recombinase XerC
MTDIIDDYADHLRDLRRADSTIETYTNTLRQMDAALPLGLVHASEDELRTWLREGGWSKSTVHQRRAILVGFFTFACNPRRSPHLDYNPATYLPQVSVPRRWPRPAATSALRDVLRRAPQPLRTYYLLAAGEGARCVEIAALDREDIGEEQTLLHGKGDRHRLVPTHPVVWAVAQTLPPGPIAVDPRNGRRLDRDQVSGRGNAGLDKLGYPTITMHMLRHWFGTTANDVIGDIRVVQELLGHASIGTTQIYVQASKRLMQAAVKGIPLLN